MPITGQYPGFAKGSPGRSARCPTIPEHRHEPAAKAEARCCAVTYRRQRGPSDNSRYPGPTIPGVVLMVLLVVVAILGPSGRVP